jgi:hypothetical protein
MNQNIHTHLEKLKTELDKLEPAVRHLQQADKNATELVEAFGNIHEELKKHLQNIEKAISETNQNHLKQIKIEFDNSIKKLNEVYIRVKDSNDAFVSSILELLSDYNKLQTATSSLVYKIEKIDFPIRLDKLDATVSSINQGLQNTQTRLGDVERNVKDEIQAKSKDLNSNITSSETVLKQQIDTVGKNQKKIIEEFEKAVSLQFQKQIKENKLLRILLFVSIGFSLALLILHFV